ncbi:MAG TPA: hypothetical protein VG498_26340 [Terriglobales bacterium]|nr:hypothetical protein [Terriglobales bacterium]
MDTQTKPMVLAREAVMVLRRNSIWIMAIFVLAAVAFAGWTYAQHKNDNSLSSQFRTSAQQAFRAINTCESYKLKRGDIYHVRELEAKKAVAAASALARTHADRLAAIALSDYLHDVKVVHLAWQNRDRKSGKHRYAESSRELQTAKQKVHTLISIS